MFEEIEEPEEPQILTAAEVELWVGDSSKRLQEATGLALRKLAKPPSASKGLVSSTTMGIELPLGSLFYPCCGSDIEDAIKHFGPGVEDYYFADPYNPPGRRRSRWDEWHTLTIPHTECVVLGPQGHWRIPHREYRVYSYRKDGLLTLLENVQEMSVFYYRGDSTGEGGSNQKWLSPVLFHTVLAKLLDGGLIVTDGSNCSEKYGGSGVPWSPLCRTASRNKEFEYAAREFLFVRELNLSRGRRVNVWKVVSSS
jgi:hypothetical protein